MTALTDEQIAEIAKREEMYACAPWWDGYNIGQARTDIERLLATIAARDEKLEFCNHCVDQQQQTLIEDGGKLRELRSAVDTLKAEIAQVRQTVGFFASVIKSGEPWTEQCEQADKAIRDMAGGVG